MLLGGMLIFSCPTLASLTIKGEANKLIAFRPAKSILKEKVYGHKGETFYCSCKYQKKSIKLKTCHIKTKKYLKRKARLEWEHVVPAHAFGQSFVEWRQHKTYCPKMKSARKCARKKNKLFKEMEGNLHNLVPSVGSINAVRSNYSFNVIVGEKFELCDGGLKLRGRKVSPPANRRGDVARIYFYMDNKYPKRGIISSKNKKMFKKWNSEDPVDMHECRLEKLKSKYQGDHNLYISKFCKDK